MLVQLIASPTASTPSLNEGRIYSNELSSTSGLASSAGITRYGCTAMSEFSGCRINERVYNDQNEYRALYNGNLRVKLKSE